MIRSAIKYILLGIIPVAIVCGVPTLLFLVLGKEVFGYLLFILAMLFVLWAFGMLVEMIWDDHKRNRDSKRYNSDL
jgi:MFS superfamily sulfate permease-like transporter